MMNDRDSSMAANAICFAAEQAKNVIEMAVSEYVRPSVVFKAKLEKVRGKWMASYGELEVLGASPAEAMSNFDDFWHTKEES